MIDKQPGRAGTTLVTFRLPIAVAAESASVVGEFNDWSTSAHPMSRGDDGFTASIPVEAGRTYRYRYLLDGQRWENDWAADAYVSNEFGGDDSVIDLTNAHSPNPANSAPPQVPDAKKRAARDKKT